MPRSFLLCALCVLCVLCGCISSVRADEPAFKKLKLTDTFYCEGANVGDFNGDGKMDVVSGPFWYEGPDFTKKHAFMDQKKFDPHNYSENFLAFTHDFNADGNTDILIMGFPGKDASWFENPGNVQDESDAPWKRHVSFDVVDNESPTFTNIVGDDKPELVFMTGGKVGYATPDTSDPAKPWTFHGVSPKKEYQRFTHGLGVGDVNGDGKNDLLEHAGWWEQPASLDGDSEWKFHPFDFGSGGAQMYAYDVDGDGANDVITSIEAHKYGLAWFKQVKGADGAITFEKKTILGASSSDNPQGICFTQMHAIDLVDMDGDGLKDIITGKRWWAHGPLGDPESNKPAVTYWFQLKRDGGNASFVGHKVDDDTGIGTQVVAADANGDGKPDIIVGNKKGTTLLLTTGK